MKKILAFIVLGLLSVSLLGCGGSSGIKEQATTETTTEEKTE